jgi:hypothetical protein
VETKVLNMVFDDSAMERLMRCRAALLSAALLACAISSGCGDGKPYQDTSMNEATVSGVVKAHGEPVTTGGNIQFNGSNSGRIVSTRSAPIGPDGRYTIKVYTGVNVVTYEGEIVKKYPGLGLRRDGAEVQSGENSFDFDIMENSKSPTFDKSKMPKTRKR